MPLTKQISQIYLQFIRFFVNLNANNRHGINKEINFISILEFNKKMNSKAAEKAAKFFHSLLRQNWHKSRLGKTPSAVREANVSALLKAFP